MLQTARLASFGNRRYGTMKEENDEDNAAAAGEADSEPPRLVFDAGPEGFVARLKHLRVAAILDDFSYACFRDECDLRQLTPGDWRAELKAHRPEMLLVESAWRGKDQLWQGRIARFDPELAAIVAWCGERGIPTVFWNKEDPVHFRTFMKVARRFDYVFTTDIDSIAGYQAALGHGRVFLLPFACQPRLTNPIERTWRRDAFSFAGGYYTRYPARIRDFAEIIGALRGFRPVEIFDRGQGAADERYRYPPEYAAMIVGTLPFERIDQAYKGYRYAVNFNSIKQSQSMFARRVFELLASNTLTVSNYSRGVRLMFGDLVIASDGGDTILRRLHDLEADDGKVAKLRLAALRKVLAEHTAEDRLAYVVGKVAAVGIPSLMPPITMVGKAVDGAAVPPLVAAYRRQTYAAKRLVLVTPDGVDADTGSDPGIRILTATEAGTVRIADLSGEEGWLAPLHLRDYYGPSYLLDLALATRYAPGPVIGKASHHVRSEDGAITLHDADGQYRIVDSVPARAAIVRTSALTDTVAALFADIDGRRLAGDTVLSIDAFSYCRDGGVGDVSVPAAVDDLPNLDIGQGFAALTAAAENIRTIKQPIDSLPRIEGSRLATMFRSGPFISFASDGDRLRIDSKLAPAQRRQRYTQGALTPAELGVVDGVLCAHMVATPGLTLRLALRYVDEAGDEIGTASANVNDDVEFDLPEGTAGIHVGMRIMGPGAAHIDAFILGHRFIAPATVLSSGDHLVLTDSFPSYDDPGQGTDAYRAATMARSAGHRVDVFCLGAVKATDYHEYEGIDCITGTEAALAALIAAGHHRSVEVCATDAAARAILSRHAEGARGQP